MTEVRSPTVQRRSRGSGLPDDEQPGVNEAVLSFRAQHGMGLRLTDNQARTVAVLLQEDASGRRAEVYLGLVAAGAGVVPGDAEGGRARFDNILDAAEQVWVGRNLGRGIQGKTAVGRLESYAQTIRLVAQEMGLTDVGVDAIRRRALEKPGHSTVDTYDG